MSVSRRLVRPWVCARCQLQAYRSSKHLRTSGHALVSQLQELEVRAAFRTAAIPGTSLRGYRTSTPRPSQPIEKVNDDPYLSALAAVGGSDRDIRDHLAEWQRKNGTVNMDLPSAFSPVDEDGGSTNDSMRLHGTDDIDKGPVEDSDDAVDESFTARLGDDSTLEYEYLSPGDYVEMHGVDTNDPTAGVFVREIGANIAQIYTTSGKWLHVRTRLLSFSIPGFMDATLLKELLPHLPQQEDITDLKQKMHLVDIGVPREVASPVLTKLVDFMREVQSIYRRHASDLDSAHSILAHQTDLRFGTLEKIARKLLGRDTQPSGAALAAVRRSLLRSQGFSIDLKSHRYTRVFLIQPKEHVDSNAAAAQWIREWQNSQAERASAGEPSLERKLDKTSSSAQSTPGAAKVESFVQKARLVIEKGRKIRPSNNLLNVSPSTVQHAISPDSDGYRDIPCDHFDDADRVLINFLLSAALRTEFKSHPRYNGLISALLGAIDKTHDDLIMGRAAASKLLSELGVAKPYENRTLHNEHMLLPNTHRSKSLTRLRDAIDVVDDQAEFPDQMQHLRRDWKDLNIYALDPSGALNIDDGISVEPVAGQVGQWWLRIHVANPTARINKNDNIARMAAHMTETYYTPDDHYWMLPEWLTQKFMSLAADRPVLTFSARVDADCNILEYDVEPGVARKVHRYTPQQLIRQLGSRAAATPERKVLTVGDAPEWFSKFDEPNELPSIPSEHLEELKKIADFAAARAKYRASRGAFINDFHAAITRVDTTYSVRPGAPNVSRLPVHTDRAHFLEGDPAIRMSCPSNSGYLKLQSSVDGSVFTVQEMMLLAGEIGGRWCAARNIPIMYRGTYDPITATGNFSGSEFYNLYIQPHVDKHKEIPAHLVAAWLRLSGRTATTLTPMHHALSGLDQYARLTTPLGRYNDMISHWQIESALREEAESGKSLVGSTREDYLAFTRAELAPVVPRLRAREQLLNRSARDSASHWMHQLMFRAHHFGEAELPSTLEVVVSSGSNFTGREECVADSKILGMSLQIEMPSERTRLGVPGELYWRVGDHWEVELKKVDTLKRVAFATPLRLLHREPYHLVDLLKSDLSALVV